MPIPSDDASLDHEIETLYDSAVINAANIGGGNNAVGASGRLQALSQRRLVQAIERATAMQARMATAQENTNRHVVRLERIGLAVAVTGAVLAVVQVVVQVW